MGNKKNIEQLIREKMQQLQIPYEPKHWQLMEERLRNEPGFKLIDEDELISLARLHEAAEKSSLTSSVQREQNWDILEQRLYEKGILTPRTEPETLLRNSLRYREEPYNSAHWQQMSRHIDHEFSIVHRLIRYKVVEVAIMLLLIISILQYEPLSPFGKSLRWFNLPNLYKHEQVPSVASAKRETERETQLSLQEINTYPPQTTLKKPDERVAPPVSLAERHTSSNLKQIAPAKVEPKTNRQSSIVPQSITYETADVNKKERKRIDNKANTSRNKFKLLAPLFNKDKKIFAKTETRKLKAKAHKPLLSRGRTSLWAAYDYNRIYSPRDPVFNTASYLIDSFGLSAGVDFGIGLNNWEFRFGAAYSSVAYRSFTPTLTYGNFSLLIVEDFDGVQYDMLEIPVSFSLYLNPSGKRWDAYVSAGASGVFVLNNSYKYRYDVITSSEKPNPTDSEVDALLSQSKLKKKNFSEGIFEGGSWKDNSFLFGQISLGLERRINARWQVYLEPTYRVHLSNRGLGPNRDHLRNLSLRLGLKAGVW